MMSDKEIKDSALRMNAECFDYCHKFYETEYDDRGGMGFLDLINRYKQLNDFNPDGHVTDTNEQIDDEMLFLIRIITQFYLTKAFHAMKINMSNPNVAPDLKKGNIGTPGRIAKIWCGSNINDDRELGSGRWAKKPRLAAFPNGDGEFSKTIPVTKKIDIISNCSHHFIPFSSIARPDSYAVISYFPKEFVLGISKLQRIANWVSQRFFLQEDLSKKLYMEISNVAGVKDVYVGLFNLTHGCETFRGSKSKNGTLTTEYYGGKFKTNPEFKPKE